MGEVGVGLDINQGILNKVEDGMSFARSIVIFLLGLGVIVFDAFAHSEYGAPLFEITWYRDFFKAFGLALICLAPLSWIISVIHICLFGKTIFSMKTELKKSKHEIESLIYLRLTDSTGKIPPDHILEILRRKPHLIPLIEELLMVELPNSSRVQNVGDAQKTTNNPTTE